MPASARCDGVTFSQVFGSTCSGIDLANARVFQPKFTFSMIGTDAEDGDVAEGCTQECAAHLISLKECGRTQIILTGVETHVCIQQTALDFIAAGFSVFVPVDAVSSNRMTDRAAALQVMRGILSRCFSH